MFKSVNEVVAAFANAAIAGLYVFRFFPRDPLRGLHPQSRVRSHAARENQGDSLKLRMSNSRRPGEEGEGSRRIEEGEEEEREGGREGERFGEEGREESRDTDPLLGPSKRRPQNGGHVWIRNRPLKRCPPTVGGHRSGGSKVDPKPPPIWGSRSKPPCRNFREISLRVTAKRRSKQ